MHTSSGACSIENGTYSSIGRDDWLLEQGSEGCQSLDGASMVALGSVSLTLSCALLTIRLSRAGFRQLWALGNYTWWGPLLRTI